MITSHTTTIDVVRVPCGGRARVSEVARKRAVNENVTVTDDFKYNTALEYLKFNRIMRLFIFYDISSLVMATANVEYFVMLSYFVDSHPA